MASSPNVATTPPAAAKPPAEDAAADAGEAIDTFANYMPTALPQCLVSALSCTSINGPAATSHTKDDQIKSPSSASPALQTAKEDSSMQGVIEILDSDDEENNEKTDSTTTSSSSLPSTTSEHAANDSSKSLSHPDKPQAQLPPDIASHSFPACESALLASVAAPRASEESGKCLIDLAKSKALSPLQLEGASLAISRHNRLLLSENGAKMRAGFFLGDAAGIGKGRQISAVIKDSCCRGRPRHLWISVSRELCEDAKRDLSAVACHVDVVHGSEVVGSTAKSPKKRGVLFVTYAFLVSGKRMQEIVEWLTNKDNQAKSTFDGVIVLDEAHKAKNLAADTQTAQLVVKLQNQLPLARILYCSATGVSDISHMVYANRLGLWGAGSGLYPDFNSFSSTLKNRGSRALELLALEMKQSGMFVARTLSWEGAEFETLHLELTQEQTCMYDAAAGWWSWLQQELKDALRILDITKPTVLWRAYWSALQRFFREMCVCAKIPTVANEAKKLIQQDYAIVVGLQSTGEAGTQSALDGLDKDTSFLPTLVSTVRSVMIGFVQNHFPVCPLPPEPPKLPPNPETVGPLVYNRIKAEVERIKALPPPLPVPELVERQRVAVQRARELHLPPNPLDNLIDQLGGESQVAELTGRSGRILRYKGQDRFHYVKRAGATPNQKSKGLDMPQSSEEFDKLNIVEKKKFMDGRKSVAIISDAASTGISLHAAEGTGAAHKRRVHFTIELPWAADKAIQQLGRSHRSGQTSAPIYKMVVTELGGERRFGAAVAKRMANLGALTKGDRRAATGSDLAEFDIDSLYGRRALTRFHQCVRDLNPPISPCRHPQDIVQQYIRNAPLLNHIRAQDQTRQHEYALLAAQEALGDVGLGSNEGSKKNADIRIFLNRIQGLPVLKQNLVFSLFHSTLDDVISDAKATGEFEGSVEEVKATRIDLEGKPEVIAVDVRSGAETCLVRFVLDRGISLESAVEMSQEGGGTFAKDDTTPESSSRNKTAATGFYVSKNKVAGRQLILFAKRKVELLSDAGVNAAHDPLRHMVITRPNTGKNPFEMSSFDLSTKYRLLVSAKDLYQLVHEKDTTADKVDDDTVHDDTTTTKVDTDKEQVEKDPVHLLKSRYPHVARLWNDAYHESNEFEHTMGLAPRKSRLGLVTGPVLHVLPALEKAVVGQKVADRALRVARVQTGGRRFVGIKFPLEEDSLLLLTNNLAESKSKQKASLQLFQDEPFCPIDKRMSTWAMTKPKTMKSFFSPTSSGTKRKERSSKTTTPLSAHNDDVICLTAPQMNKKTKKQTATSIASFFVKK